MRDKNSDNNDVLEEKERIGKVYNILLNHLETVCICEQLLVEYKKKKDENKDNI